MSSKLPKNMNNQKVKKPFIKKLKRYILYTLFGLSVIVFCILFTSPGNKFIAFSANSLVPGLSIKLNEGRFLYQDPFSVIYDNKSVNINIENITIGVNIWQCAYGYIKNENAVCLDSLALESANAKIPNGEVNLKKLFLLVGIDKGDKQPVLNVHKLMLDKVNFIHKPSIGTTKEKPELVFNPINDVLFNTPVDFILTEIKLKQFEFTQASSSYVIEDIELKADFFASKLNLKNLALNYQDIDLSSKGMIDLVANNPINLSLNVNQIKNKQLLHGLALKVTGDFSQLNVNLKTIGQYPSNSTASLNLKEKNYPFNLKTDIQNWQHLQNDKTLKLNNLNLVVNGSLKAYDIKLISQQGINAYPLIDLNLLGNGDLTQFTLDKLSLNTSKSAVELTGDVQFKNKLVANVTGELTKLNLHDLSANINSELNGVFDLNFTQAKEAWLLSVNNFDVGGSFSLDEENVIPFNLNTHFILDNQLNAEVNNISLTSGINSLSLRGKIDQNWQLQGNLDIKQPGDFLNELSGKGLGSLVISGKRTKPEINWQLGFNDVKYQQIKLQQAKTKGFISVADNFKTQINLFLNNGEFEGGKLKTLNINIEGDKFHHRAAFSLNSDWVKSAFNITGGINNNIWQTRVSDLYITDNIQVFNPTSAIDLQLNINKKEIKINAHCWQSNESNLCIEQLNASENSGDIRIDLLEFNLATIAHFLPPDLTATGSFSGDLNINWQQRKLDKFEMNLGADILELSLQQEEKHYVLPVKEIKINAHSTSEKASLNAVLNSDLFGSVSSELSITDIMNVRNLDGVIKLNGFKLDKFKPFIQKVDTLSGDVYADINISGPLLKPFLSGELSAKNIDISGDNIPVAIKDSHLNIGFIEQKLILNADIFDDKQGNAKVKGELDWQSSSIGGQLDVIGHDFNVKLDQGIKLRFNPDLQLIVADNEIDIKGKVEIPYGRIAIESLPEGAVKVSDDEVIFEHEKQVKDPGFFYALDLSLIIKDDVKVDSFGLISELEGDLSLQKGYHTPLLTTGDINLINGVYQSLGQDLQIQTGQVGFSGAIEKPYLNIKAIRNPVKTADGVIAGITLTGNVEKPKLAIFSEPTKDQAEALSYLLNGQSLDGGENNKKDKSDMLTQLLLSQGLSRGEGLVSKIGSRLGVEDVALGSTGSGDDTKVEISGYLLPGVQVKYSVGVFEPLTEIVIRYQLLPQLYIEAINGVNDSLDILYKFDWD